MSVGFPGKSVISCCLINPVSYGNITCGHGSHIPKHYSHICRSKWAAIVTVSEINRWVSISTPTLGIVYCAYEREIKCVVTLGENTTNHSCQLTEL